MGREKKNSSYFGQYHQYVSLLDAIEMNLLGEAKIQFSVKCR